jgi:hypothetical protein
MNVRSINSSTDHNRSYVALCWRQPWQGTPSINLRWARPFRPFDQKFAEIFDRGNR